MKRFIVAGLLLSAAFTAFTAFRSMPAAAPQPAGELKWYTWEEAVELNKTKPKKIFVDVYTDWCGWCKKMDKSTFTDPAVAAYLAENFYPVKFNAEQRAAIDFNGYKFEFQEQGGGRGVHMLAYSLLDGKLGYPAFVYLNEKFERIMISPGYKDPAMILPELKFTAEEAYLKQSWEEYRNGK